MPGHPKVLTKNVVVLGICQALAMTGASLIVTMAALAGQSLASNNSLATLPIAIQFLATKTTTIPASLLMGKVGRRVGFTVGQLIGLIGASTSVYAIWVANFWLFTFSSALLGTHNAFWQYYRFAASEAAHPEQKSKAVSYVLLGGVIAAIAGPQLAKASNELFFPILFMGGYLVVVGLTIVAIFLLQMIKIPAPKQVGISLSGRPLIKIMRQPVFILSVISGMFGYGIMSLVMTATPLAMQFCGFNFSDTATVIQWHALAMFAPSFFTGSLIKRFGVVNIIVTGSLLNILCMLINFTGVTYTHFVLGLILLGLGWNFLFIGGTTLLTESYRGTEQSKVQASNDFAVFGTVAAGSLLSGVLQDRLGWFFVNSAILAPMVIVLTVAIWFHLNVGKRELA